MIPTHFYNGGMHGEKFGDGPWLVETIDKLPIRKQKPVAARYSEIYQQLVLEDPKNYRYRCNVWLRKIVEKYKPINDGLPF
tara:strand:+ start:82 stop:324 length:243 start_codon:yes stop_codon:yes gene_type:complete